MKNQTLRIVRSAKIALWALCLVSVASLLSAAETTVTIADTGATADGQPTHIEMQLLQQINPAAVNKLKAINAQVGYRGGDNRVWINVDFKAIPPKSFVVSAVFKMFQISKIGMPQGHRLNLCVIQKHVTPEHLSWKGPVEGIDWTKPGADQELGATADRSPPVATDRVSPSEYGIWRQWDVTGAIQSAVTDQQFNGFLLFDGDIHPDDSNSGLTMFCLPTDHIESRRPVLIVKFADTPVDRTAENSLFVPEKPLGPIRGFQVYREGELPYDGYKLTKFAMISSGAPLSNFSASFGRGMVGQRANGTETRLLIRFDGLMATRNTLAKATLDILCQPGEKLEELQISRVTQGWNTTNVCWQECAHRMAWSSIGGTTQEIRLPTAVTEVNGLRRVQFDVTPWVESWLINPAANYGMLIRFSTGRANVCLPEDANNGHRPMLNLEFGPKPNATK